MTVLSKQAHKAIRGQAFGANSDEPPATLRSAGEEPTLPRTVPPELLMRWADDGGAVHE